MKKVAAFVIGIIVLALLVLLIASVIKNNGPTNSEVPVLEEEPLIAQATVVDPPELVANPTPDVSTDSTGETVQIIRIAIQPVMINQDGEVSLYPSSHRASPLQFRDEVAALDLSVTTAKSYVEDLIDSGFWAEVIPPPGYTACSGMYVDSQDFGYDEGKWLFFYDLNERQTLYMLYQCH